MGQAAPVDAAELEAAQQIVDRLRVLGREGSHRLLPKAQLASSSTRPPARWRQRREGSERGAAALSKFEVWVAATLLPKIATVI